MVRKGGNLSGRIGGAGNEDLPGSGATTSAATA
jgi:hypothetical protein